MSVTSMKELLERKKGAACLLCNLHHPVQTPCNREALNNKISNLVAANAHIPALLQTNKEVTELAETFREMLKKADEAHTILMEICSQYGETGEAIKEEYLGRLGKWATGIAHIDQSTQDQQELFNQEPSTLPAIEIKDSTRPLSGRISGHDSSP